MTNIDYASPIPTPNTSEVSFIDWTEEKLQILQSESTSNMVLFQAGLPLSSQIQLAEP